MFFTLLDSENENSYYFEGFWSVWEDWGRCSATCGGGRQTRNRRCVRGNCSGSTTDSAECNTQSCGNGSFLLENCMLANSGTGT